MRLHRWCAGVLASMTLMAMAPSVGATGTGDGTDPGAAEAATEAFFPAMRVSDVTVNETDGGTVVAQVKVTLPFTPAAGAQVNFVTRNGSATAPDDFFSQPSTVLKFNGQQSVTISVLVKGDTVVEQHETFDVGFFNPVKVSLPDPKAVVTIKDNERRTVHLESDTATEADSGQTNHPVFVRLDAPALGTESFRVRTINGTATAGSDYVAMDQVVTLSAGTLRVISIQIIGDLNLETAETFTIEISSPTNVTIGQSTLAVTIADNDGPGGIRRIVDVSDPTIIEANSGTKALNFNVVLSGPANGNESFVIRTSDITATAGSDYVARTNVTVNVPAGATQRNVTITTNGDTLDEGNETLLLEIVSASGLAIDANQGVGTITDND